MSEPRYYLRERGRVTGPFDLDQLKNLQRRGALARFHQVSTDGNLWVAAQTLTELFPPAPPPKPKPAPAPTSPARPTPGLWFHGGPADSQGPIDAKALQALIDRGAIGPDCLVRSSAMTEWLACGLVPDFVFAPRLDDHDGNGPEQPAKALRTAPRLGPWTRRVVMATVLIGSINLGLSLSRSLFPKRPARPAPTPPQSKVHGAPPSVRIRSPFSGSPPSNQVVKPIEPTRPPMPSQGGMLPKPMFVPAPRTPPAFVPPELARAQPAPRPVLVVRPEPKPEPEPAPAEPAEIHPEIVNLPPASSRSQFHDGTARVLTIDPMPTAGAYALRLLGINDSELRSFLLTTSTARTERGDTLIVRHNANPDAGKPALAKTEPAELARFWVEERELRFQWATPLSSVLVAPAQALRDCLLEVRAGTTTRHFLLRGILSDQKPLTVAGGKRLIPWTKEFERPARPVILRSCQVQVDDIWYDLTPQRNPNHRRLFLASLNGEATKIGSKSVKTRHFKRATSDGDEEDGDQNGAILTFTVEVAADGSTLTTELRPSLKEIETRKEQHAKQSKALALQLLEQVVILEEAKGLKLREDASNGGTRSSITRITPTPSTTTTGGTGVTASRPSVYALAVERAQNRLDELKTEMTRLRVVHNNLSTMKGDHAVCQKAALRLRLGIAIEGGEYDVAQLGLEE